MTAASQAAPYCLPEIPRDAEAAIAWLLESIAHASPIERIAVADRLAEIRAEMLRGAGT